MYPKVLRFKQCAEGLGAKGSTYDFIPTGTGGFDFCNDTLPKVMAFFDVKKGETDDHNKQT
jgi:hypothetical protein